MNRQDVRTLLPLYADGRLDSERASLVEAELSSSAELRQELVELHAMRRCVQRVMWSENAPAGLVPAIRDRLVSMRRERRRRVLRVSAAVTAIAALIALFLWWRPAGELLPGAPPSVGRAPAALAIATVPAQEFAAIFRSCALGNHRTIGFAWGEAPCDVKAKLDRVRPFRVCLPDLAHAGYRLDGICDCIHLAQVPSLLCVHVYYRPLEGGDPVSVFSLDRRITLANAEVDSHSDRRRHYETARSDDVNVLKWDENSSSYVICSRLPVDQLHDLAERLDVALRAARSGMMFAFASP